MHARCWLCSGTAANLQVMSKSTSFPMAESIYECALLAVQLYGCNVLNLGNSKVLSVHANTARQIVRCPHFKGDVQVVNFTPITSMYGAVHCSSQVRDRCSHCWRVFHVTPLPEGMVCTG